MIKLILGVTTELLFRERKKLNELKLSILDTLIPPN